MRNGTSGTVRLGLLGDWDYSGPCMHRPVGVQQTGDTPLQVEVFLRKAAATSRRRRIRQTLLDKINGLLHAARTR